MKAALAVVLLVVLLCSCIANASYLLSTNEQENEQFTYEPSSLSLKKLLPFVVQQAKTLKIQPISKTLSTPVGTVQLNIAAIQVASLSIGDVDFALNAVGGGVTLTIEDVDAVALASWNYQKTTFPRLSDSGTANITLSMDISFGIRLDLNPQKIPVFSTKDVDVQVEKFNAKLSGGASWLYNLFLKNLSDDVDNAITSILTEQVPNIINSKILGFASGN